MEILIAPNGRTWDPHSNTFSKYFGFFGKNTDFVAHSVQNLGFSTIATFPRYTHIRFQPRLFPTACLQRVIEILLSRPPPCIVLERIGSLFAPLEVLQNLNDAIARLRVLQAETPAGDEPPAAPTIVTLSLDRLRAPKRAGLQRAFAAWRKARAHITTRNVTEIATSPPRLAAGPWHGCRDGTAA